MKDLAHIQLSSTVPVIPLSESAQARKLYSVVSLDSCLALMMDRR